MLCPEVVGRERETAYLRDRVDGLSARRGGVVVLVGEAGTGKSRLARAALDAAPAGLRVLTGRAVPGASPVPYRPLTEGFLAAFRDAPPPADATLTGFGTHLHRLVPAWGGQAPAADESPVLLGEALVRLLRVGRPARGNLLLLEDLHWADPETLTVVDYLADALRDEPVLCLVTTRPGGAADDLVERLERRTPHGVMRIAPLPDADVEVMVAACLGATPPAAVTAFVQRHSDGSPFLVEELLAGLASSGELRQQDDRWVGAGRLTPTVPASLQASIHHRWAALDPAARRVLAAAALLGRTFDWELLPGIAEVDGRSVVEGLRAAVEAQLVAVRGHAFLFRHALTREAILAELLPPERHDLATRAWPAHERANPGLPGATLEMAAQLAEAAGQPAVAARHLVESARRAAANGALTTAENTARRARELAAGDAAVRLDADQQLVEVLVSAGHPTEALALGHDLAARLEAQDPRRRADLLVVLARAALDAGDGAAAAQSVAAAERVAAEVADMALSARVDAVAASVALHRADLPAAAHLARTAIEAAATTAQPAVEGEAHLVLGHVLRTTDSIAAGLPSYRRAGEVAAAAGLAELHLRAVHEQALVAWSHGDQRAIREVRELGVRYGALVTVAAMDLSLADMALASFDQEGCRRAAAACVDASRRYGLASASVAHLWLAGGHALGGDRAAMQASIADALAADPHDPRILGDLYGRVLVTAALVDDELDRLRELLDTMIEHARAAPPTTSVYPGRYPWALLHTIDGDDLGAAARAELTVATRRIGIDVFHRWRELVEAVAQGRAGQPTAATERFAAAYDELLAQPLAAAQTHTLALLAARAALRDGWGDPVRWLRGAEAFFGGRGYDRLARRCRILLGEAGAPIQRRGRGDSEVPAALRARGVTSREVDVLKLVAAGRSNKEVADTLFLSPKTVERHLSSLFIRLEVANRRALVERAAPHLGDPSR